MTIEEVKQLAAKNETRTLELKKTTGELHRGMETACAFLNSDGGWLFFGVALTMQSCREQGLPEPKIEIVPNFVNLTIWFKDLLSAQDTTRLHKTAQDCTRLHKSDLTETERKIVDFCLIPRTLGEIAEMLGMNNKRWVREKYVAPLIGSKLTYTIPDTPNSRYQKYQTIEE